jgi:hypothetical protein
MGEEGQTLRAGTINKDDAPLDIASTRDVIDNPGELKTQRTCHGAEVYPSQYGVVDLSPLLRSVLASNSVRGKERLAGLGFQKKPPPLWLPHHQFG